MNMLNVAKALRKNAEEFATCGPGESIRKALQEVARAIEEASTWSEIPVSGKAPMWDDRGCEHMKDDGAEFHGTVTVDDDTYDVYTFIERGVRACCFRYGSDDEKHLSPGSYVWLKERFPNGSAPSHYQACMDLIAKESK